MKMFKAHDLNSSMSYVLIKHFLIYVEIFRGNHEMKRNKILGIK